MAKLSEQELIRREKLEELKIKDGSPGVHGMARK